MKKVTFEDVRFAADRLESAKADYLRATGWHYSSSYPDHRWRWFRKVGDKQFHFATDEAVRMQSELDDMEGIVAAFTVTSDNQENGNG